MKPNSESSANKPYLGYNFSCAIQGSLIPQRLQNLCIRDYAATKKLVVGFSASEYTDTRQSLILMTQFDHIERIGGFIFYSLMLLPPDDARRAKFYDLVIKHRRPVHFALEDLCLAGPEDRDMIERMYRINLDPRLDDTRRRLISLAQAKTQAGK